MRSSCKYLHSLQKISSNSFTSRHFNKSFHGWGVEVFAMLASAQKSPEQNPGLDTDVMLLLSGKSPCGWLRLCLSSRG